METSASEMRDSAPPEGRMTAQSGPERTGLVGDAQTLRDIVAVGGGKGGIGKSLLTANLAVHLAQKGRRVILVDADLGG